VHTDFSPIFGVFAIFDYHFAKIVAPPGAGNGNSLVPLKEQSLLKKDENGIKIAL